MLVAYFFFFLIIPGPPKSTLFPYTTLFRSGRILDEDVRQAVSRNQAGSAGRQEVGERRIPAQPDEEDRKSTRLNSSHSSISYAVFCLKKKKYSNYKALSSEISFSRGYFLPA